MTYINRQFQEIYANLWGFCHLSLISERKYIVLLLDEYT